MDDVTQNTVELVPAQTEGQVEAPKTEVLGNGEVNPEQEIEAGIQPVAG